MLNILSRCTKTCASLMLAASAMIWNGHAHAIVGAIDNVPSATLLLPYFEADLGNPNGGQTVMRISNSSASAILTHVTLWTDLGVPTLQFDMYLTGYDSVDLDFRLLFQGIVPQTASAGQDPGDKISPKGSYSQDINFASCTGILPPLGLPPTSSGALSLGSTWEPGTLAAIRAAHTGQASTLWSGQCGAVAHGDNIARGYVTIDAVNNCTQRYPGDPGYFGAGGSGDVTYQNVLFGSYTRINRSQNYASTANLVNVEASLVDVQTTTSGRPTFYSDAVSNTAADNREALGAAWQVRTINGGAFPGGTQLIVWRDPGVKIAPFTCGGALPAPFPLTQQEAIAFDDQEHFTLLTNNSAFPYATQVVNTAALSPYGSGFIHLNLSNLAGTPLQSFVSAEFLNPGHFASGTPAHLMATQSQLACSLQSNATPPCVQTYQPYNATTIP